MADGMNEIQPAPERPRDSGGRFAETQSRPEPIFAERAIEGDPVTGDTSDGGADQRLLERERDVADGREVQRREPQRRQAEDVEEFDGDPEQLGYLDEPGDRELEDAETDAEKYEVTIGGKPHQVTLAELQRSYVSAGELHQRAQALSNMQSEIDAEYRRQQHNWGLLTKARADYEEDFRNLLPAELDWDRAFAANPAAAHEQQKIYQALYAKLAQSQQQRAQMEQFRADEEARRVHKYAVDGFSKFVMDNIKLLPDEPTLKKNILSMRRTAADAGFNEYEVSTVYDPRMLTVLFWASKYRRMMAAARPKAAIPGKGRTLTPGAASPLGSMRRSGFDDAQRRLASSGSLQDAAEVFRRGLL